MICVRKEIKTHNGLFRIGAVVLNDTSDFTVKPICADNDFMLHFVPYGRKGTYEGTYEGKKHFCSLDEAEAYVHLLNLTGFYVADL